MWEWYEKRDTSRIASVPGLIGEPSLQDLFSQSGKHFDIDDESRPVTVIRKSSSPRTLNDLHSMTISAKEAQWGQQEESGVLSADFPAFGNDFFDDDSNASSDSGVEHFEDSTQKIEYQTQTKDKSTVKEAMDISKVAFPASNDIASELLTPSVKVSNAYINISLNNQSIELAQRWKLGDYDLTLVQPTYGHRKKSKSIQFSPLVNPLNASTTLSTDHFSKQGKVFVAQ
jgi:hypothetical protein